MGRGACSMPLPARRRSPHDAALRGLRWDDGKRDTTRAVKALSRSHRNEAMARTSPFRGGSCRGAIRGREKSRDAVRYVRLTSRPAVLERPSDGGNPPVGDVHGRGPLRPLHVETGQTV